MRIKSSHSNLLNFLSCSKLKIFGVRNNIKYLAFMILVSIGLVFVAINKKADAYNMNDFVIEVDTTKGEDPSYTIPVGFYSMDYSVDCDNDGVLDAVGQTSSYTCTYPSHGTYTIAISGNFPSFYNGNVTTDNNKNKIIDVKQWGGQVWKSLSSAFSNASNLNVTAVDTPNLSQVTSLSSMFSFASSLNSPLSSWDVSNVTDLSYMFFGASSFNQPLNSWDVSKVTNLYGMFYNASTFNQPLNNWDTSSVTNMGSMFLNTDSFNQPLDSWNISNAIDISYMFFGAKSFNQPLNNWDTSNVTNMSDMFSGADAFNQPLNDWDTSNVTNMSSMFFYAESFDWSIGNFNLTSVSSLSNILYNSSISNKNYDLTLSGWSKQSVSPGLSFSAMPAKYCNVEARSILTSEPNNWTIIDGGKANAVDCPLEVETNISSSEISSLETVPYVVGNLSISGQVDPNEVYKYTLFGDNPDNSSFTIEGDSLILTTPIDYPQKTNYEITVRVANSEGSFHDQTFNITVMDGNTPDPEPTPTPDPVDPDGGDNSNHQSDDVTAPNTGAKYTPINDNPLILPAALFGCLLISAALNRFILAKVYKD